tara:strand:- start:60 stop:269 length:210 start_codon:yes stop_codon:yes gene_type:complete
MATKKVKDNFDRTMNFWNIGLTDWFKTKFLGYEEVKVRARNKKGHFVKDDPKTKKNEAYKTVTRKRKKK